MYEERADKKKLFSLFEPGTWHSPQALSSERKFLKGKNGDIP